MFCASCGGEYAEWVHKCPYCGSVNERADERLYMQHLEEVRKRLDVVDEESEMSYRAGVRRGVGKAGQTIAILAAAVILLGLAGWRYSAFRADRQERKNLEFLEWSREEFPKLDEWYAAGDYDRILEEYHTLLAQKNWDHSILSWPHYYFAVDLYGEHDAIRKVMEPMMAGEDYEDYLLGSAIYGAMRLKYTCTDEYLKQLRTSYDANGTYGITAEEEEKIKVFRQEAQDFFEKGLGWTEAETDAFYEECRQGDVIRLDPCYKKAEEIVKNR